MIDFRRFESVSPTMTDIMNAMVEVKQPDGNAFNFVTNTNFTSTNREVAFYQVCDGVVQENDLEEFKLSITSALEVKHPEIFSTYSVTLQVLDTEEYILGTG